MLTVIEMDIDYEIVEAQIREAMSSIEVDDEDFDDFIPLSEVKFKEFKQNGLIDDFMFETEFAIIREIFKNHVIKTYHTGDRDILLNFNHLTGKVH